MCLPWRCRQLIAIVIILTSVVCDGQLDNSGKMYPRGNHWAVGHLMGKKSTDTQIESEERDRDMGQFATSSSTGGRELDRTLGPSSPFWAFIRTLLTTEQDEVPVSQNIKHIQKILEERRQADEQRELHRHLKEVADWLLQALVRKQSKSS
ncbi:gastrin-releasing peptide [Alosa sapidissima]|uniref:gastrin-releasing peptide n=1 Tax=Alosa sapidissima TaxID=34773 RepID=UPI001C09AE99|nr:gastrin-releasing peptide [Alosa sapidissima]